MMCREIVSTQPSKIGENDVAMKDEADEAVSVPVNPPPMPSSPLPPNNPTTGVLSPVIIKRPVFHKAIHISLGYILVIPLQVYKSYTATLSSNLIVSRLQRPTDKLYGIGFQDGSFVKEMLTKRLNFNMSRIKSYASVEKYQVLSCTNYASSQMRSQK
ncbi:hypothetical protein AgCh_024263 [Apium graveolens]